MTSVAPPESFQPNPDDGLPPREFWTCNGTPVHMLPNPTAITWGMTDQAMAERMRKLEAQGGPAAVITTDSFDKRNEARVDHVIDRGGTIETAPNERKALADKFVKPGFQPRFLGGDRLRKNGTRGYEVVKDEDGNPVRYGEEVLAQIPIQKFKSRRIQAAAAAASQREGIVEKIHDQQKSVYEAAGLDPALVDAKNLGVVREQPY